VRAHCFRKKAGINTNMSIESLKSKYFFLNQSIEKESKVTIDKLLLTGIGGCENVNLENRTTSCSKLPTQNSYEGSLEGRVNEQEL
jgi:hypothetical protein